MQLSGRRVLPRQPDRDGQRRSGGLARLPGSGAAGFVCTADEAGAETPVVDDAGNPIPFDATNPYDAAENTTRTRQESYGAAAQLAVDAPVAGRENHLFVGAAANEGRASFTSQSALARLTAARPRARCRAGIVDADSRVAVDSVSRDLGAVRDRHALAAARSVPDRRRALQRVDAVARGSAGRRARRRSHVPPPEPGAGHQLPAAPVVGGYAGYSESTRVPTPLELTCASETDPCRLPNGFISDPPLAPVVARTFEVGVRGRWKRPRDDAGLRRRRVPDHERRRHPVHQLGRRRQPRLLRERRRHAPPGRRGEPDRAAGASRAAAATRGSNGRSTTPISTRASRRRSRSCRRRTPTPSAGRSTSRRARASRACRPTSARRPSPGSRAPACRPGVDAIAQQRRSSTAATRRTCWRRCPASSWSTCAPPTRSRGRCRCSRSSATCSTRSYGTFGVLGDATPVLGPAYTDPRFVGPGRAARGLAGRRRQLLKWQHASRVSRGRASPSRAP